MPVPDRLNTNTGRPLKPTLASTRTAKTPVTPRLAPSAASASSAQSARTVRSSNVGSTPRANTTAQEDVSTPVKSFLNHNITPRSSSRKSRVGTVSPLSTPIAAPSSAQNNTRPASTIDFGQREQTNGTGLGLSGWNGPRVAAGGNIFNTTPTPKPTAPNVHNQAASEVGGSRGSGAMFFHASDVRPQETAQPPKKTPAFFYVNGQQDESSRSSSEAPSPPLSSVGRPKSASKFFHADSIPDTRGPSPILPQQPASASPEPWPTMTPLQQNLPPIRPPSPSKDINVHLSNRKGASQVIRPNPSRGPSVLSTISGSHASNAAIDLTRRKSSAASSVRFGHSKSASLSSIDSVTSMRKGSLNDVPPIAPSPLNNESRAVSDISLPEEPAYAPSVPPELSSVLPTELLLGLPSPGLGLPSSGIQSPIKTSPDPGALARMNELAANARRERKVLDLEISNSSLLAINRSLEREVRKQKAELRRFRRMSRAGRFSVDTISSDPESFSAIGVDAIGNLSDMSEGEEVEQEEVYIIEEEEDEVSDESSIDEGTMSPTSLAARDAAHLEKDEKRLQLDLSKHQELLLDSQKMNQSLKRCMNWTEELIKEGQKALAYKVNVSDVKLGGRVLVKEEQIEADDDDEDAFRESRGLLSPWTPSIRGNDPFDSTSMPGSERTDRDSGVDLDGLKSLPPELRAYVSPLGSPMNETHSRPRLSRQFEGMDETY